MLKKLILAAALAGTASAAVAETSGPLPDADPALWVVKDDDTTVYLFGTFHLLDGKRAWFNDEVKTAFDASDEVVFEAIMPDDPADMQPLVLKYAVDPSGATLASKLTPELEAKFTAANVPPAAFGAMEPWFASMALTSAAAQKLGLTGEHGPETVLTAAAREREMPIGELEGAEFQLSLFDKMPEAQQLAFLGDTLDGLTEIEATLSPMLAAWSSGDTEKLVSIMNEGLEDPALYDLVFTNRNASWAEWIDARMDKPGTVFLAVGAGHLSGKNNVRDLLETRGISSARVE